MCFVTNDTSSQKSYSLHFKFLGNGSRNDSDPIADIPKNTNISGLDRYRVLVEMHIQHCYHMYIHIVPKLRRKLVKLTALKTSFDKVS